MAGNPQESSGPVAPVERGAHAPPLGAEHALAALGALPVGVVVQVASGEIVFCNPAAERILGMDRDQMAGRTSLDPRWRAIHEDGSPFPGETHPAMVTLRTGDPLRDVVMGVHTPDGSLRWISVDSQPIPGPDGQPASVVATFVDVTDRRRAEERYGSLFREMLNGFALHEIVCDREGRPVDYRFLAVNPAFERMTGLKAETIVGRTVLDVLPATEPRWVETYGKVALTGEPVHFESYAAALRKRFEITAYRPAPLQFACIFADVTERRAAEESLKVKEAAIASSINGMAISDLTGRLTYVNAAFVRMWGYETAEEILGTGRIDYWKEPDAVAPVVEAVAESGHWVGELLARRKEGSTFHAQVVASRVDDEEGRPTCMLASFLDISGRKRDEEALRQSQALLETRIVERTNELRDSVAYNRSLIEASVDPLVTIGPDGRILDVNEATIRATGALREHLVGSDFSDYFTDPERARGGYSQVFREGVVRNYELQLRHRDGGTTPVEYNATLFRDAGGNVLGVFAAARDISARKEFEAELREANRELEAFSYSISHELRAPLRAIDGQSALLARELGDRLDGDVSRRLARLRWNAQRMGQLIDDLLAFSRAGRTNPTFRPVEMTASASAAFARAVSDRESLSRISFSVDALPEAAGDPELLSRVWENLLRNAVKFSATRERPEIRVEGGVEGDETVYRVRDNGVGFDMKYVDKLFGVFNRLHGIHEFEGTGVGLALVRRIVLRHGGRVWAEGEIDQGATFSFSLPARKGPETPVARA